MVALPLGPDTCDFLPAPTTPRETKTAASVLSMALASGDFGIYSHDLLVGQFGSGNIAVYDPQSGHFLGMLEDATNAAITIDGLWDISFGSGGTSGPATTLYFTAGIDHEQHGVLGSIVPVENTLGNGR